jgi:3-isopropylmalate dehydrogenase
MSANDTFHIAVLAGDGIGPEVMAPALEVLKKVEATSKVKFRFTEAPAGANNYRETGKSMPESTVRLCDEADAILLGACGLPSVRYPDNTEIMPQVELRFLFDLYAGVRPARLIPGVPSPIVGAAEHGIDLVLIRESTEGLFASMGKGVVTHDDARETMVITRKTSQRLFDFSFRLAQRRKAQGKRGMVTCVDKANVFKAFAFFRGIFDETAVRYPDVATERIYVDACAAMLVKRPWDFDVMPTENMFGDILSDLTAGLVGGMGMAPSADIGDRHAVFQPCHGTAPDIMGQGKANPTAMILSAAMMLDWLADKHGHDGAAEAAQRIERAVDKAFAAGIRPLDLGGRSGTADTAKCPASVHRGVHDLLLGRFQRREFLDHLALSRHQDAVGQRHDLGQIGRDHHHGFPLVGEAIDQVVDFHDGADVDAARRLVEDDQVRLLHQ